MQDNIKKNNSITSSGAQNGNTQIPKNDSNIVIQKFQDLTQDEIQSSGILDSKDNINEKNFQLIDNSYDPNLGQNQVVQINLPKINKQVLIDLKDIQDYQQRNEQAQERGDIHKNLKLPKIDKKISKGLKNLQGDIIKYIDQSVEQQFQQDKQQLMEDQYTKQQAQQILDAIKGEIYLDLLNDDKLGPYMRQYLRLGSDITLDKSAKINKKQVDREKLLQEFNRLEQKIIKTNPGEAISPGYDFSQVLEERFDDKLRKKIDQLYDRKFKEANNNPINVTKTLKKLMSEVEKEVKIKKDQEAQGTYDDPAKRADAKQREDLMVPMDLDLISPLSQKQLDPQDFVSNKVWMFEPFYGMAYVRDSLSYGDLLKEIRLGNVECVHWFTSIGVQEPNPHCLVEMLDLSVKKAKVPHTDWRLQYAMESHNVQQVMINPTPVATFQDKKNFELQVQKFLFRSLAFSLPVVFFFGLWYAGNLVTRMRGDQEDRQKLRQMEAQKRQRMREQSRMDSSILEVTGLVKGGMTDDQIVNHIGTEGIDESMLRDMVRQERVDQGQIPYDQLTEFEKQELLQRAQDRPDEKAPLAINQESDQSGEEYMKLQTMQIKKKRDPLLAKKQAQIRQAARKMKGITLQYTEEDTTFFSDVAGIGDAKVELAEVVDFFIKPERFQRSGARVPRGVVLYGPPGNGKTLLARAVAGEAGVAFIAVNASEFVEMFVGVGAARVRDLFATARREAPAIIFIDEIDAIGRRRKQEGTFSEREQTLNQCLSELDGFQTDTRVIVIVATNRIEVLDPALIRPGRFDRIIEVQLPDLFGRLEILELQSPMKLFARDTSKIILLTFNGVVEMRYSQKPTSQLVHASKSRCENNINLMQVAAQTDGKSGADLAQIVNTAATLASRDRRDKISQNDLTKALVLDTVGQLRPPFSKEKARRVAVAQAASALVAYLSPSQEAITYVSIEPREYFPLGQLVQKLNEVRDATSMYSKRYLLERMSIMLASRAAEEIIYGENGVSTLNQQKFFMAQQIAQKLCVSSAMNQNELMSNTILSDVKDPQRSNAKATRVISEIVPASVSQEIEAQMMQILEQQFQYAKDIILKNRKCFEALIENLLDKQILFGDSIDDIISSHIDQQEIVNLNREREMTISAQ